MAIPNSTQHSDVGLPPDLPPLGHETDKPKKGGWIWIAVLIALVAGAFYYYKSRPSSDTKAAPAPGARAAALGPISVAVMPALKENVPYYLSGLGTVTAFNTVTVKSRVDGQLQKVSFTEGQFVHEGDLLAQIDPRPFQVALEQMEGQLSRDQAQLNNAKVDFKRYDQLAKEGVIASQQVDTQNATVGQLEGAVRADQAQIDNEKLQLTYCRITAPITGRVGLRLVDQGNMIHSSDANGLVVITQVQPIAVLFTLPEDNLPDVISHMKSGQLGVEAYSRDDQTRLAQGKLVTVDNQIDPTTGTVRFKAAFDNHDLSLWPNQFVNTRLMLTMRKDAIVVPLAAIQRGTQGSYVFTVKNGKASMQPVKIDLTQGNIALIASGVAVGDQVVVDGQERLQAGTAVEAHTAGAATPANPAGGANLAPPAPAGKDSGQPSDQSGNPGNPGKKKDKKQGS
jgi:multidrug efflux system membrane fusion protein